MAEKISYRDTVETSPDGLVQLRAERAVIARRDLSLMLGHAQFQPKGILECGSGIGGVTQALKDMYPSVPIAAIDLGSDSQIVKAAASQNASFTELDARSLKPDDMRAFAASGVDTVVAMRMPAEVVLHLVKTLRSANFHGVLVASVIDIPVEQTALRELAHQKDMTVFSLEESRLLTERGYLAEFQ